jgi:beta-glucosidase
VALQTAREGIVLLRNQNNLLPLSAIAKKKVLVIGKFAKTVAEGLGSAKVEGYNKIKMIDALQKELGKGVTFIETPTDEQLKNASTLIVSVGTSDSESWDRPFALPEND